MTWTLALHHPANALDPFFVDSYSSLEAVRIAVGHLRKTLADDEIIFRFQTPATATEAEIDELRCMGLVNEEAMAPE